MALWVVVMVQTVIMMRMRLRIWTVVVRNSTPAYNTATPDGSTQGKSSYNTATQHSSTWGKSSYKTATRDSSSWGKSTLTYNTTTVG